MPTSCIAYGCFNKGKIDGILTGLISMQRQHEERGLSGAARATRDRHVLDAENIPNKMHTLPIEVLEEICKHLTGGELAACGAVCRRWRELFDDDCLWRPRCDAALEETLRTTRCFVRPHFVSPETSGTLGPVGRWKLAYMRENRLWNNWCRGNAVRTYVDQMEMFETLFISNHIFLKVHFKGSTGRIEVYDSTVPTSPVFRLSPVLLEAVDISGTYKYNGSFIGYSYVSNPSLLFLFYTNCSDVFNLDLKSGSIQLKYKVCLPKSEFGGRKPSKPGFAITPSVILGINPSGNHLSETLHIWDITTGIELHVEKCLQEKPFGFSDIMTSKSSDNAVVVVSDCINLGPRGGEEATITYHFCVYNANELKYLPFVEVFKLKHGSRYECKIHGDFLAIAIKRGLKIYNYRSHRLLTETAAGALPPQPERHFAHSLVEVIDDCFVYIEDEIFQMFHPPSRTFVMRVELKATHFNIISDWLVQLCLNRKLALASFWRISRHSQRQLLSFRPKLIRTPTTTAYTTYLLHPYGKYHEILYFW